MAAPTLDALKRASLLLDQCPNTVATDVLARKLSFSEGADELPTTTTCVPDRLKVFVRARPLAAKEVPSDMVLSDTAVSIRTTRAKSQGRDSVEECSFSFDTVFSAKATQTQVFDGAMLPQVRSLFLGKDTLTFAYGVTNAGKTYTIQGRGSGEEMGLLPRALEAIFEAKRHHEARKADAACELPPLSETAAELELDDACSYEVRASFLEVYGNDAFDLLAVPDAKASAMPGPTKRTALRLKEDRGQVVVQGLKEVELSELDSAVRVLQLGWAQRAQASNSINDDSSRSHAVLCVKLLTRRDDAPTDAEPTTTRLCVVDLAGAERQKKTNAHGVRLNEATSINKDLMVLGHCLRDLRYNQMHAKGVQKVPPFRESRITMLFRDYLSGNGQISVIAALSPRQGDVTGALDTLRFAAIAQQVKVVDSVKLAPSQIRPAGNLPRVATGAGRAGSTGAASAATGGTATAAAAAAAAGSNNHSARQSLAPSMSALREDQQCVDLSEWSAAAEVENAQLREQIVALQERMLAHEADRLTLERSIREEVASEMKEHLESTEAEMKHRLELERYNAEELYLQKLALVKGSTEKRADMASVHAHSEIIQQARHIQEREEEHQKVVKRLEEELAETKGALAASAEELEAQKREAAAAAEVAAAAAAAAMEEAVEPANQARAAAESMAEEAHAEATEARKEVERLQLSLEESEARCARGNAEAESLAFKLESAVAAKEAREREVADLQTRLNQVVDLTRPQAASKKASKKKKGGKDKSLGAVDENSEVVASSSSSSSSAVAAAAASSIEGVPAAVEISSPGLADVTNVVDTTASVGDDSSSPPLKGGGSRLSSRSSDGKASRSAGGRLANMFRGRKKETAVAEDAGCFLDIAAASSTASAAVERVSTANKLPEVTPWVRRTRAGTAARG